MSISLCVSTGRGRESASCTRRLLSSPRCGPLGGLPGAPSPARGPCPFPQPFAQRFLPTLAYAIFSTLNGLLSLLTWQSPEPSSGLGLNVTSQIQSRAPLRGFQRTQRLRCTDPACDQVFLTRPRPGLSRWTVRFRRARNVSVLLTAVSAESRTVPGT